MAEYKSKFPADEAKPLQKEEVIVQSLINLRDELFMRNDSRLMEAFWKINSCLYSGYPREEF